MLYQLLRPFSYLTIKNIGNKSIYDFIIPTALTFLSVIIVLIGNDFDIFVILDKNRFPNGVFDIVKNLPGFYIAALAAIATFNKTDLDNVITNQHGVSPTVDVRHVDLNGQSISQPTEISRRVFLCMLFAYLTAISFVLLCTYVLASSAALMTNAYPIISSLLSIFFIFVFWQIIVCTFFGLYYLADKLHH